MHRHLVRCQLMTFKQRRSWWKHEIQCVRHRNDKKVQVKQEEDDDRWRRHWRNQVGMLFGTETDAQPAKTIGLRSDQSHSAIWSWALTNSSTTICEARASKDMIESNQRLIDWLNGWVEERVCVCCAQNLMSRTECGDSSQRESNSAIRSLRRRSWWRVVLCVAKCDVVCWWWLS